MRPWPYLPALAVLAGAAALPAPAQSSRSLGSDEKLQILVAAYPEAIARADGNDIVFKDGTRLPFDDGTGAKDFETLLARADIEDMFAIPYPKEPLARPPALNADPGRIRNGAFFRKMYGDCTKGEVAGAWPTPSGCRPAPAPGSR